MKKTFLFWLMFVTTIIMAVYFSVRLITVRTPGIDLTATATELSARPTVKKYAVRRLANGRARTRTELHRAIAAWTDGASTYPITADGTIINSVLESPPAGTVIFRGIVPDDIAEIAKLLRPFASHLSYAEWIENRRWDIYFGDTRIMLPEGDPTSALKQLATLDANKKILTRDITVLDMRDAARILVK